jgi:MFS transporter, FSR family, fosmidomycin resistance protein
MAAAATMDLLPAIRRERLSISLVGWAHSYSHFSALMLYPLFPFLTVQWGISYVQLAAVITVFNIAGLIAQTPAGMLVDKIGSRRLLIGALLSGSTAFITAGILSTYWGLLVAGAFAGLANSVYHPADYDLLHRTVNDKRVGRAFSVHTFMGYVGNGTAPLLMIFLYSTLGLKAALVIGGSLGIFPAIALMFATSLRHETVRSGSAANKASTEKVSLRQLLTPTVISLTLFFTLISLSGLQSFMIPALHALDGISIPAAGFALTVFLVATSAGVLTGGYLADKTARHELIATIGFLCMAAVLTIIGSFTLNSVALCALFTFSGFCGGLIYPSRDMLVRKCAPAGAVGRTFGIVTTGFNLGGLIGPLLYGSFMDRGEPRAIFYAATCFLVLTALTPLFAEGRRKIDAAKTQAAPA